MSISSKIEIYNLNEKTRKMEKVGPLVKNNKVIQQIQNSIVLLTNTPDLKKEIYVLNNTIKENPYEAKEALVDLLNFVDDKPSLFNQEKLNELFDDCPPELRTSKKELKNLLLQAKFKTNKNNEVYLYFQPEGCLSQTELAKDKLNKDKAYSKSIAIVGNIAPSTIEINHDKGYAVYGIAVSQGKDKDPVWYNCTTFNTKQFESLQKIKEENKGIQVTLKGSIQKNTVEKDEGKQYYTNIIVFSTIPTKEFELPKVSLVLKGSVFKELEIKTKEDKEFATLTMVVDSNNKKEFYNLITSNKEHIANLKDLKNGDSLKINNAHITPKGQISITKLTQINDKVLPSCKKQLSKEQGNK